MIDRILEQAPAIRAVLSEDRSSKVSFTWSDTDVLTAVNNALKPVAEFTDLLSAEKYVTSSSVLPLLEYIRDDVLSVTKEDVTLTSDIKQGISSRLDGYYDSEAGQKLIRKCAIVDPRYKDQHAQAHLAETKAEILAEMVQFAPRAVHVAREDREGSGRGRERPSLGKMLQKRLAGDGAAAVSPEQQAKQELDAYLREVVLDGDRDPLLFWKSEAARFPLLSVVARKYLCVCATSAASERVFSTAGLVLCPARNLLKPEKVNMLVFLAKNLEDSSDEE